jgi:thiol-disulfide isomerase/thioredoxin
MKVRPRGNQSGRTAWVSGVFLPLAFAVCGVWVTGCDKLSHAVSELGVQKVEARTAEDSIEAFLTYQEALLGKDSEAVTAVFGKPKGVFQRRNGTVWMYERWTIEFDARGLVQSMERDIAAYGSGSKAAGTSMALAARPSAPSQSPSVPAGIREISNGGQPVDLNLLMTEGKITVVDFYADWCGPCRKISPRLEQLVSENPEVVLVKVDIVDWDTPVTRQHDIHSVPNIRVFDRNRRMVGSPTSNLQEVETCIDKAGG